MALRQAAQRTESTSITTGLVEDLSNDGRGVVHLSRKTVFIEGALSGEDVDFQIVHYHREYDEARLRHIRTKSAEREILARMGSKLPPRIVYISRHPATLARDANFLVNERKYKLLSAGIVDMFPHTALVESMAVFARDGSNK